MPDELTSPLDPGSRTLLPEPGQRIYYPELDGMRFVAIALVYLFHRGVPQFAGWVDAIPWALARRGWTSSVLPVDLGERLERNGWVGVQLFFILSGFLITTLLLREEARYGRIDLRAFWMRRILRIWPLYYLTLALGFVAIPLATGLFGTTEYANFLRRHLMAFLLFLGNWSMGLRGPVPFDSVSILWSVCVEEQFYILGPLLLVLVPNRWRVPVVVSGMAAGVVGRYAMARAGASVLLFQYATTTHVDTLLAGVLLALVTFRTPPGRRADRLAGMLQWPLLALTVWLLTRRDLASAADPLRQSLDFVALWGVGAGWVAVAIARRGWIRAVLSYRRMVWLGKISYGLYMFHEIALGLSWWAVARIGWFPNREILRTIAALALTLTLAATSYYLYERPFLARKRSWTRVPSRPI